jgi:hypothetical protein
VSLTALVFTVCSLRTMQCVNYVNRLYGSPTACQFDAIGARQLRHDKPGEPIFVRCVPTSK